MTVVRHDIVLSDLELFVRPPNGLVPLLSRVICVVQHEVLERTSESQLSAVHSPHSNKIKDGAVRSTDSCVSDTGKAAGNAGKSSPNDAVGEALMLNINSHFHFEFLIHLYKD
jgi:hypothetical protein